MVFLVFVYFFVFINSDRLYLLSHAFSTLLLFLMHFILFLFILPWFSLYILNILVTYKFLKFSQKYTNWWPIVIIYTIRRCIPESNSKKHMSKPNQLKLVKTTRERKPFGLWMYFFFLNSPRVSSFIFLGSRRTNVVGRRLQNVPRSMYKHPVVVLYWNNNPITE